VCAFIRRDPTDETPPMVVVANFTPVVRDGYDVGVPVAGTWSELLNSDRIEFGGSGVSTPSVSSHDRPLHGQPASVTLRLPPLAVVVLEHRPS